MEKIRDNRDVGLCNKNESSREGRMGEWGTSTN